MSFFVQVNGYNFLKNGVKITVFDTPGFADRDNKEEDYVKKIREKVTKFDVFVFCTEMNTTRFRDDDVKTIQKLTEAFGPQLWEHAVVGLTFANKVDPPRGVGKNTEEFFDHRTREFKGIIFEELGKWKDLDINIFVNYVEFAPTGDSQEPELPGISHWITALWVKTFKRLNNSAKPAFFLANMDRFRPGPFKKDRKHSPLDREGMNCGGGSSTGFVPPIYLEEHDQVMADLFSCDQNGDTASDHRPSTTTVSMEEISTNSESHLRLRSATSGTDHEERGLAESFPSINLVPPPVRENLRDAMMWFARGAVRVIFQRILSGSGSLVAAALGWIFNR